MNADQASLKHVAIIMDGNGRWAQSRRQPRVMGHRAGMETAKTIVRSAGQAGVPILTLFAFGQENWRRPGPEVNMLMRLFVEAIDHEIEALNDANVQVKFVGDLSRLPVPLQGRIEHTHQLTDANTGLQLNIAMSFSGRWQILKAIEALGEAVPTEARMSELLSENGRLPDVDLLIRTSGVQRMSNFLLWQLAYAECVFCEQHWPAFTEQDFLKILEDFHQRQRRFGMTAEQIEEQIC